MRNLDAERFGGFAIHNQLEIGKRGQPGDVARGLRLWRIGREDHVHVDSHQLLGQPAKAFAVPLPLDSNPGRNPLPSTTSCRRSADGGSSAPHKTDPEKRQTPILHPLLPNVLFFLACPKRIPEGRWFQNNFPSLGQRWHFIRKSPAVIGDRAKYDKLNKLCGPRVEDTARDAPSAKTNADPHPRIGAGSVQGPPPLRTRTADRRCDTRAGEMANRRNGAINAESGGRTASRKELEAGARGRGLEGVSADPGAIPMSKGTRGLLVVYFKLAGKNWGLLRSRYARLIPGIRRPGCFLPNDGIAENPIRPLSFYQTASDVAIIKPRVPDCLPQYHHPRPEGKEHVGERTTCAPGNLSKPPGRQSTRKASVKGDVATFVTFNRIRPPASRAGSSPRPSHAVGWPRLFDSKPD